MIIRCVMYAFAREMLQLEGSPRDEIVVVSGARMMHVAPSPSPSPPPPPHFLLLRDGIGGRGKGEVLLPSFIGELGEGEGEGGRRQDLNAYIPSLIMFVCLFYPPRARYKWAVISLPPSLLFLETEARNKPITRLCCSPIKEGR